MAYPLPPDGEHALDFAALVETLRLLEGETVVAAVSGSQMGPTPLLIKGELRHEGREDDDRTETFCVGDGRVELHPSSVTEASLYTSDGNEFFQFEIAFDVGVRLVIADPETA